MSEDSYCLARSAKQERCETQNWAVKVFFIQLWTVDWVSVYGFLCFLLSPPPRLRVTHLFRFVKAPRFSRDSPLQWRHINRHLPSQRPYYYPIYTNEHYYQSHFGSAQVTCRRLPLYSTQIRSHKLHISVSLHKSRNTIAICNPQHSYPCQSHKSQVAQTRNSHRHQ